MMSASDQKPKAGGHQQFSASVKPLNNWCVFCSITCLLQTRGSFQTAHAGADRHQQHSVPVSVCCQPLARGQNGEKPFSSDSEEEKVFGYINMRERSFFCGLGFDMTMLYQWYFVSRHLCRTTSEQWLYWQRRRPQYGVSITGFIPEVWWASASPTPSLCVFSFMYSFYCYCLFFTLYSVSELPSIRS